MDKIERKTTQQLQRYQLELPAQFTSWNGFYDELIRLELVRPDTPSVQIKLFKEINNVKADDSLSNNLIFERQHIERMCLEEFRQQRAEQSRYMLASHQIEQLIEIVSNQAYRLTDWDLLVKLKELLTYQQQQEKILSTIHVEPGQQ
ncbi:hypothetical protein GCM10028805_16170 [Spirosoma harenae]